MSLSRAWVDDAGAADWQQLAVWVDWLTRTHEPTPSRAVLPCWQAHRGVAEELAALRAAWQAAATAARAGGPNDQLVYWHDRWLHSCLSRLREVYKLKQCSDRHVPVAPARSTDPDLLATALLDAADRRRPSRRPAGATHPAGGRPGHRSAAVAPPADRGNFSVGPGLVLRILYATTAICIPERLTLGQ
jgi:hypothetical protein